MPKDPESFCFGVILLSVASLAHLGQLYLVSIPLAIYAIVLLGISLKKELNIR